MYQILIYRITPNLWRWELRRGGALVRCGTSHTQWQAQAEVKELVSS